MPIWDDEIERERIPIAVRQKMRLGRNREETRRSEGEGLHGEKAGILAVRKRDEGKGNSADRPRGKPAWAELRRRENTAETAEDSVFLPTLFSFPHPKMWKKWITWNSLGQDGGNPFQADLSRAFNLPLIRSLSAILPYKIFTQASDLVF